MPKVQSSLKLSCTRNWVNSAVHNPFSHSIDICVRKLFLPVPCRGAKGKATNIVLLHVNGLFPLPSVAPFHFSVQSIAAHDNFTESTTMLDKKVSICVP